MYVIRMDAATNFEKNSWETKTRYLAVDGAVGRKFFVSPSLFEQKRTKLCLFPSREAGKDWLGNEMKLKEGEDSYHGNSVYSYQIVLFTKEFPWPVSPPCWPVRPQAFRRGNYKGGGV